MYEGEVPGTMYGLSDSGWINSELFDQWFLHHFLPHAPSARPLLLLLDGHSSQQQVVIVCLPPYTTHETQPLDKGPFGPLKLHWREACKEFLGRVVTRFTFSKLFGQEWRRAMTHDNIVAGIRCTGVFPVDREKIVKRTSATERLTQDTGGCFIPLFSPRQKKLTINVFTSDEQLLFQKRFEGYDIQDDRYELWKRMYHPDS